MGHSMKEDERFELVSGEVREGKAHMLGGEGLVFGDKESDSFFSIVGLVLECFYDFCGLGVVEERGVRARNSQQSCQVHKGRARCGCWGLRNAFSGIYG